jgi:hypothetical protein
MSMSVKTQPGHRASHPLSELSGVLQRNLGRRADPAVMSSPKVRKVAVIVGATGLLAAATGCGGAAATSSSGGQGASPPAQAQQPSGARAPDASALAKALGVSTADLQKAMQALPRPTAPSADGQGASDRITALAKALGLSEAKVRAAMQATRPSGAPQAPPSGAAPPSSSSGASSS